MIDVFVRMAATPVQGGVVAESVRWSGGADPSAPRHQVVTLFGDPSITHLTWALAAANRGRPDAVWRVSADGSAVAAELCIGALAIREDAAVLLSDNGPQLRAAIAHLLSITGQEEHSAAIRVPISLASVAVRDDEAILASLREAEGVHDSDSLEEDLAA